MFNMKSKKLIYKKKKIKAIKSGVLFWVIAVTLIMVVGLLFQNRDWFLERIFEKKSGHVFSNIQDKATFTLYLKEIPSGEINSYIDLKGNYIRKIVIGKPGFQMESTMAVLPDRYGDWKTIRLYNPMYGYIEAKRTGNKVKYFLDGKKIVEQLPETDYTLYDDLGPVLSGVMIKKYDLVKKGKQSFDCFRIKVKSEDNSSLIQLELNFLDRLKKSINGIEYEFLIFNFYNEGDIFECWVDRDYKIYMLHSKLTYQTVIRSGFEELLPFKIADPKIDYEKVYVRIPMRDGMELNTVVFFPGKKEDKKKYPVILIRTPYSMELKDKDGENWAVNGYICAIQDVRGRHYSSGNWEPFVNEAQDGYDTIEWLAGQEWSNGKVGMIGSSYEGLVQLLAAALKPPHLVTIIPNISPSDPYNLIYYNGLFRLSQMLYWLELLEIDSKPEFSRNKEPGFIPDEKTNIKKIPLVELFIKLFNKEIPYLRKWIKHNYNDMYWQKCSVLDKLPGLNIPVFLQSGWFDGNCDNTMSNYRSLKKSKNKFIKMIMGPWLHMSTASTRISNLKFGDEAGIDLNDLYKRWFDYWLKGIDSKILDEPLVQLYDVEENKWLFSNTYPIPGVRYTPYYLSSTNGANSALGDGILIKEPPTDSKPYDQYEYDPENPTLGPLFEHYMEKKLSQMVLRSDEVLVFVYENENEEFTIAGPISIVFYASSSAVDTDWLFEIDILYKTGKCYSISHGGIRARYRNSFQKPELLEKNKIYKYSIELGHFTTTIKKGAIIRLLVSSSFYLAYSRNLNTGGNNEMETNSIKASQRIYHSPEYPSHLILPVIPGKSQAEKK
jgi:putative CocE/NonD family hydrolase